MRFDPTAPPGNFQIRRYSETAAPLCMPTLLACLQTTLAFHAGTLSPARRAGSSLRRRGARPPRPQPRPRDAGRVPSRCTVGRASVVPAAAAPTQHGSRPCGRPLSPRGAPRTPGGLARACGRRRAWGTVGEPAAAALASASVCDMAVFLVGTQQPDSFRTCGVGIRLI